MQAYKYVLYMDREDLEYYFHMYTYILTWLHHKCTDIWDNYMYLRMYLRMSITYIRTYIHMYIHTHTVRMYVHTATGTESSKCFGLKSLVYKIY